MGGLGNQLFIYAAARSLALRTGRELKLDLINGFAEDTFGRSYLLDRFPIQATMATADEVNLYYLNSKSLRRQRKLNRYLPCAWKNYYEERSLFDLSLTTFKPRRAQVYLEGYWQRESYFTFHSFQIREELRPQVMLSAVDQFLATQIEQSESVSLHIRRNDYAHVLGIGYYERAIKHMRSIVKKPVFFIFSDNPAWAKTHIPSAADVIHVDSNTTPSGAVTDLHLMSCCRHHIIANSTFSWWGAWLAAHNKQKVVAPAHWGYRAAPAMNWTVIPN
ncbi:MAG: alpha-1,2-fucosyltransferase [Opitutus sp.]|nr:alpha-1,2-fucosyltransferase [Opitutus sp.]MCS6278002.1 alpha-1,2-fucosyltransferase [Opitutus sp.]MCS6298890.1 alpha-1,2-fucosyltransferase [Opitutus sp.]